MTDEQDLRAMRLAYDRGVLMEADLAPDPLAQFRGWLVDAVTEGIVEPNAMVVSTVSADGVPSARTVLLKDVDARGFAFYTNLTSRKGRELAASHRAACVFPWLPMHRQVVVAGTAVEVPREEAADYFASRPHGSRIGAWTSRQSEVIADRSVLDERYAELLERYPDDVPLPDFWGGWIIVPETIEFWQGRESRLHDRLRYRRVADGGLDDPSAWTIERLSP
ncbi:MAG: pyridoxamine 5'-phosphate oxidase [Candidatus Nanopelagicales bacterium]